MTVSRARQQRLGAFMLAGFFFGMLGLSAATPVRNLIDEHVLNNVVYAEGLGFSEGFGALPTLVKDRGGSEPVPFTAQAPLRTAEYRDADWLRTQDAAGSTLQIASFGDEKGAVDFLATRPDRAQFVYFSLPDGAEVRYVVTYGSFASRAQAEEVAATLGDLPGQPLPRLWGIYLEQLQQP